MPLTLKRLRGYLLAALQLSSNLGIFYKICKTLPFQNVKQHQISRSLDAINSFLESMVVKKGR